jgi:DedD protein
MAEQQEDIDSLKRRGRRRLVGAVALVLAAVIVLPMVFDPAPKSSAPPVSVRIPSEDDAPFKPKLPPKPEPQAAAQKAEPPKAEPAKVDAPKSEPAKPEPARAGAPRPESAKVESKPVPKAADTERARAEAALKGGAEQFYVQVGAFSNPQPVIARLAEAKMPYYVEEIAVKSGKVVRVRAGPFATRAAAESAAGKLKNLGLPGSVGSKAG